MSDVAFDSEVRLHLYRAFVETGAPPTAAVAAEALGRPEHEVAAAYRRLAESRVIVLDPAADEVWMANPLSAVPTPFRVSTDRGEYYGNCIWDAFGVVAMLGGDGSVRTSCPDCEDELTFTIHGGELRPAAAVVHFAVPARHWWDDIGYT